MPRHLFPGGNTCHGFYSFYQFMATPEVKQKIILKGGPGVGKSNLMKKLAERCISQSLNIDYFWCSSDNDSLDGVVIGAPEEEICILDGTAPHSVVTIL